jgi:hypothetical protein
VCSALSSCDRSVLLDSCTYNGFLSGVSSCWGVAPTPPSPSAARAGSQAIKVCVPRILGGARLREEPKPEAQGLLRGGAEPRELKKARIVAGQVGIVSADTHNFRDKPAPFTSLDMHDEVHQITDFGLDGPIRQIHIRAQRKTRESKAPGQLSWRAESRWNRRAPCSKRPVNQRLRLPEPRR